MPADDRRTRSMPVRLAIAMVVPWLVVSVPTASAAEPAPACTPTEVTEQVPVTGGIVEGHFDLGSQVVDGQLVARVKDDRQQPPSWVDPASVTFRLTDAARREVPADDAFRFLGAPGATIWSIGQVQEPGVPWLGWNTQHESLISAAAGPVTFVLDAVEGPGQLAVYATGSFGGVGAHYLGTAPGFPDRMEVDLNLHVHANWAFTQEGVYRVRLTQQVPLAGGSQSADTAMLTIVVGDATHTTTTHVGRTADGQPCELTATQREALPDTGLDETGLLLGSHALLLVLLGGGLLRRGRRRGMA